MFHELTLEVKDTADEVFEPSTVRHKVCLFHTLGHNRNSNISIFLKVKKTNQ